MAVVASGSLVEQLRKPFLTAYMDGRNEHGTHLLIMQPASIFSPEIILDSHDQEQKEALFKEAEAAGHQAGHNIAILLKELYEDSTAYFVFNAYCPILTAAFFGTAAEQHGAFDANF